MIGVNINNLENFVIDINAVLEDALQKIDLNKKRFLIVTDKELVRGVVSDGDIRRAILKNNDIHQSIQLLMNPNYKYLLTSSLFDEVSEKFKYMNIEYLPIVDNDMRLVNIITKKQFHIILLEDIEFDLRFDFSTLDNYIFEHSIYNRPWGFYKSTLLTAHAQSKIITVFPNSELSLQEHKKREEHWVIIKGAGKVILGESEINVYPGKYIYIPKGCKHQLINNSKRNIIFSEVQLGDYFGEDDIIRYSDKYGRAKN